MSYQNPKFFACQTNNANCFQLEEDLVEMMKIIQNELNKRNYKAVVIGIIKDQNQLPNDISCLFN